MPGLLACCSDRFAELRELLGRAGSSPIEMKGSIGWAGVGDLCLRFHCWSPQSHLLRSARCWNRFCLVLHCEGTKPLGPHSGKKPSPWSSAQLCAPEFSWVIMNLKAFSKLVQLWARCFWTWGSFRTRENPVSPTSTWGSTLITREGTVAQMSLGFAGLSTVNWSRSQGLQRRGCTFFF